MARIKVHSWRYIRANPNDGEASDSTQGKSLPTIMQLNKALDILDKKEEALEALYYPSAFVKQTNDGFSSMS